MVDDEGGDFQASFPDIFADYQNPTLTGDINMGNKAWDNCQHAPMTCWQCQLNFAVWCAIAGCGVSADDHLQAKDPLLASLYRFHVYYATRRLLVELKVALPGDQSHSWYQNAYDARAYKRICIEFGVSPDTDWRQKLDRGCQGFGSLSTYMEPSGAYRHSQGRDGIRRSKAVPGQRRRRHHLARRHPQQHRSLSKDVPVCINPSGLRLWDWNLPRPERHGPPPGQCPGLQRRNRDRWI